MVTALKALNAAKLCPQVLAVEEDCFVDEWKEPKGIEEEKKNPNYWKECGELLAKVHMVPTTWWEPLRS